MRFKPKLQEHAVPAESNPKDFSFSVTRIAVAQICRSVGFKSTQLSSLDILTDVAIKYLISIAKSAVSSANSSSRTQSNIFDVLYALNDVNFILGFTGASRIHESKTPLQTAGFVEELIQFVKDSREIPFAKPVPGDAAESRLPLIQHNHITPSLSDLDDRCHIPRWLPAFPDAATYAKNYDTSTEKKECNQPLWGEMKAFETIGFDRSICEEKKVLTEPGQQESEFMMGMVKRVGDGIGVSLRNVVSCGEKRVYCNTARNEIGNVQMKIQRKASNVML